MALSNRSGEKPQLHNQSTDSSLIDLYWCFSVQSEALMVLASPFFAVGKRRGDFFSCHFSAVRSDWLFLSLIFLPVRRGLGNCKPSSVSVCFQLKHYTLCNVFVSVWYSLSVHLFIFPVLLYHTLLMSSTIRLLDSDLVLRLQTLL